MSRKQISCFLQKLKKKLRKVKKIDPPDSRSLDKKKMILEQWEVLFYLKFRNLVNYFIRLNYRNYLYYFDVERRFFHFSQKGGEFNLISSMFQLFLSPKFKVSPSEQEGRNRTPEELGAKTFEEYFSDFSRDTELR